MNNAVNCTFYFGNWKCNRKKLFEEALSNAKYGKVLYISKEEINELPELSQELSSVNKYYLKMVSFLYAKSLRSLVESVSTLPDWQNIPCAIILDDLSKYCNREDLQNACGIVALLINTSYSCTFSETIKSPVKLYISVTKDNVGDEYCNTLKELYSIN